MVGKAKTGRAEGYGLHLAEGHHDTEKWEIKSRGERRRGGETSVPDKI